MTFAEANTVEQMILDATTKLSGTPASMLRWNRRLPEFAL